MVGRQRWVILFCGTLFGKGLEVPHQDYFWRSGDILQIQIMADTCRKCYAHHLIQNAARN